MKVQIKDLKPNPFRDMDNYPINEEKVQSLINSINQTGFWDNILGRLGKKGYFDGWGEESQYVGKFNRKKESLDIIEGGYPVRWEWVGKIEIAYGHHRLIALQRIYKPNDHVDIPIRELDDPTMIRIMANENMEQWELNPTIIDETVKVTREFLFKHQEIVRKLDTSTLREIREFDSSNSIGSKIIVKFLGKNWKLDWINSSLVRIRMEKEGELDREAIKSLPTERAARDFAKATKNIKNTTPEQQREAAKNIIKNQSFGEFAIKSALLDEKYKDKKTKEDKEERDFIEFKTYVMGCTTEMNKLNGKLGKLLLLGEELKPNMLMYRGSTEARDFDSALHLLINILKEFLGKEETECQKQVVSK